MAKAPLASNAIPVSDKRNLPSPRTASISPRLSGGRMGTESCKRLRVAHYQGPRCEFLYCTGQFACRVLPGGGVFPVRLFASRMRLASLQPARWYTLLLTLQTNP